MKRRSSKNVNLQKKFLLSLAALGIVFSTVSSLSAKADTDLSPGVSSSAQIPKLPTVTGRPGALVDLWQTGQNIASVMAEPG